MARNTPPPSNDSDIEFNVDFDLEKPTEEYADPNSPPDEGEHFMWITKARLGKSASGNPMISLRYTIIGTNGPDNQTNRFKGRDLRDFITLKDDRNGLGRLRSLCMAVDPDMPSAKRDPVNGFRPGSQDSINFHLVNGLFVGTIAHESWTDNKGKERVDGRVVEYRRLTAKEEKWLDEEYGPELVPELPEDAYKDFEKKAPKGGGGRTQRDNDDNIPI